MATFKDALRLVADVVGEDWPKLGMGTMYVDPNGYEDATTWAINVGSREFLVDGDPRWQLMDPPLVLVDKRTGEVNITQYLLVADQIDKMTPVNVG